MLKKLVLLSLLVFTTTVLAQPGVAPVKTVNGVNYYIHKVEAGNTLYGLQRMYGVTMDEIVQANSNSLNGGLKVGQEVLIPAKDVAQPTPAINETSNYKVKSGETLYGISRKFNTTVDELLQLNPSAENGIQKGQLLKVPGKVEETEEVEVVEVNEEPVPNPFVVENETEQITVKFEDSIVEHKVLAHETMYSISKRYMVSVEEIMKMNNLKSTSLAQGQVLRIPVKQERIEKVEVKEVPEKYNANGNGPLVFDRKERYKIVVMAPFYLDYGKGYSEYVSNMAVHFYMGAQMAIDSLKQKGLKADVEFIDTKNDSTHIESLIKSGKLKDVDLIIGPFFPKQQKLVADYCKTAKIRMLSPVSIPEGVVEDNRLVYAVVPSDKDLMRYTAQHIKKTDPKANVILVQVTKEKDLELYNEFKSEFGAGLKESSMDNVKNLIIRGSKNIFVVPTNDKNTAMKFMNTLNKSAFRSTSDNLVVYGTKDWMNFSDVNGFYRDKFNFHFVSNTFLNYYDKYTIEANRKFRRAYNTDLSRMAAQGYDMMLYGAMDFLLERDDYKLLMNRIQFDAKSDQSYFLNSNYYVLEQHEFELIDSQAPSDGSK